MSNRELLQRVIDSIIVKEVFFSEDFPMYYTIDNFSLCLNKEEYSYMLDSLSVLGSFFDVSLKAGSFSANHIRVSYKDNFYYILEERD